MDYEEIPSLGQNRFRIEFMDYEEIPSLGQNRFVISEFNDNKKKPKIK